MHLATNQYPWSTFYRREGRCFEDDLDAGLAQVAASGLDGFEPIVGAVEHVDRLAPLLEKHGLEMRSLYVNSVLHDPSEIEASIANVLAVAERARDVGTRLIVTNPSPIQWGGQQDKSDRQLEVQAEALERLGRDLAERGLTLAYHYHQAELRHGAREFHHMMAATSPVHVTLCLDCHWTFRGCGDSAVAVHDVVTLYGERVSEVHLRQSTGGVWRESFGEGDIDYARVFEQFQALEDDPHLVLEQAVEDGTPTTLDATEAHRRSGAYVRKLLGQ